MSIAVSVHDLHICESQIQQVFIILLNHLTSSWSSSKHFPVSQHGFINLYRQNLFCRHSSKSIWHFIKNSFTIYLSSFMLHFTSSFLLTPPYPCPNYVEQRHKRLCAKLFCYIPLNQLGGGGIFFNIIEIHYIELYNLPNYFRLGL